MPWSSTGLARGVVQLVGATAHRKHFGNLDAAAPARRMPLDRRVLLSLGTSPSSVDDGYGPVRLRLDPAVVAASELEGQTHGLVGDRVTVTVDLRGKDLGRRVRGGMCCIGTYDRAAAHVQRPWTP